MPTVPKPVAVDDREDQHEPLRLHLQARRLGPDRAHGAADLADLGLRAGRDDSGEAGSTLHQRARKQIRQLIASGCRRDGRHVVAGRLLAHGHRLSGQQRFVDVDVRGASERPARPAPFGARAE
jgi:hypothetical protein